jgi:hypothetical protein
MGYEFRQFPIDQTGIRRTNRETSPSMYCSARWYALPETAIRPTIARRQCCLLDNTLAMIPETIVTAAPLMRSVLRRLLARNPRVFEA